MRPERDVAAPSLEQFCSIFRRNLAVSVEYSVSETLHTHGTMVKGDREIMTCILAFIRACPFAQAWYVAALQLYGQVQPPATLFRVDWHRGHAVALTLYLKFARPPTDPELGQWLLAGASPAGDRCSPIRVGAVLGLPGPTGIALRTTPGGPVSNALYYRLESGRAKPPSHLFVDLAEATSIRCPVASLRADSAVLRRNCSLSAVGLDIPSPGTRGTLKFDWSEVPLNLVRQLITARSSVDAAVARVEDLAQAMRARTLSYLGMKYDETGFAGWRAYFSVEPGRLSLAGATRIGPQAMPAGSKMPHY